jgi:OOP family OmpA-OmpF porin
VRVRAPFVVVALAGCGGGRAPDPSPPQKTVATAPPAPSPTPSKSAVVDTDGDRIPDDVDKCPTEPETYNGVDDDDGCPDAPKVVIVTSNPPAIERLRFKKGAAKPVPESIAILDAVAAVMKDHAEVELLQLEGHASSEKDPVKLSQQRADAIRAELEVRGIAGKRLRTKGFGAHCPLGSDPDSDRRVDLKIVTQSGKPTGVSLGCPAATAAGVVSDP